MKRRHFFNLLGLSWLGVICLPILVRKLLAANATIFYVSPDGDDRNSGTKKFPFATIEAARNAIRKLKQTQDNNVQQSIVVFLRDGIYELANPILFSPEDSGTKEYPITYKAYPQEKPIISGGKILSGWQKITHDGKQMWLLELPEVKKGDWYFRQLWFDGKLRRRARYPHQGYLKVEQTTDPNIDPPIAPGPNSLRFYQDDLQNWQTIDRADLILMNYWTESRLPVAKIDADARTIYFNKQSLYRIENGHSKSSGAAIYYIENILEILNYAGEWFLDDRLGTLYYLPFDGEEPEKVTVIAPVLSQLVELKGNLEQNQLVENINFEGIIFAHTNWYYPKEHTPSGYAQAAFNVPATIYGRGIANCTWNNCTIAHIANYALELSETALNNKIDRCNIFDIGAGGIKISANLNTNGNKIYQSDNNIISNCHIYDGGTIFHGAVGIWLAHTNNNKIYKNHIHHFYYSGISVGWTWGYQGLTTEGTKIENNHIHHIGKKEGETEAILNDKAGIYTLGQQPNSAIRANLIHDIEAFNYGAWGIYLDEGSSEIIVNKNLVYRTLSGGFHLHYGKNNKIINNIFALGKIAQVKNSRKDDRLSFIFTKNIIFWREGELAQGEWNKGQTKCDRNLYWNVGTGTINFGQWSWQQWQAKGEDLKSTIADPLFLDPDRDDFTLDRNSPAWKLGFRKLIV